MMRMEHEYILIEYNRTQYEDGLYKAAVTIVAPDAAHLPEPRPEWGPGSVCIVPDGHKFFMLNFEGEWV